MSLVTTQINLEHSICMEMFGNGAMIGMAIILRPLKQIHRALLPEQQEFVEVEVGEQVHQDVGQHLEAMLLQM